MFGGTVKFQFAMSSVGYKLHQFQAAVLMCRLKCISGQNDFKLVRFVFPLFYAHSHQTETKENTKQTSLKLF